MDGRKGEEDDPYVKLKIVQNPDGSLTRPDTFPLSPPNSSPSNSNPVFSKDVPLNPHHNTWIRIFRPPNPNPNPNVTLPIIINCHGGGFILFSAANEPFHKSCEDLALQIPALVVSVEYRLAPEHPLPAAYEDAIDAIRWVRDESHNDPCFDSADSTRCFLMGNSAGGNIAFHAALRAFHLQTPSFKIAGLIMNEPAFGGIQRTESELSQAREHRIPLPVNDLLWRMALPVGSDRDHEFSNPMVAGALHDRIGQLPKCLVTGHGQDPFVDRQRQVVGLLEGFGVRVVSRFDADGYHGVEYSDPVKGQELLMDVKDFIFPAPK